MHAIDVLFPQALSDGLLSCVRELLHLLRLPKHWKIQATQGRAREDLEKLIQHGTRKSPQHPAYPSRNPIQSPVPIDGWDPSCWHVCRVVGGKSRVAQVWPLIYSYCFVPFSLIRARIALVIEERRGNHAAFWSDSSKVFFLTPSIVRKGK